MNVLVVEDDANMRQALRFHLEREGYEVEECGDGEQALGWLLEHPCALVILDRLLPGLDGVEVMRHIRAARLETRVLMLTALGSVPDRVAGLDAGADDYLGKPFDVTELLARARSLCRRPAVLQEEEPQAGDLRLDPARRLLRGPEGACPLSRREVQLMEIFIRNPRQILPRSLLFSRVWGAQAPVEEGNLDSYIHFLRRRLAQTGSASRIKTVHGVGYRLEAKGG